MNNKGLFLIFSTAIISGFSIFINKYSVDMINPYIFSFLKNIAVALMLTCLIFLVTGWKSFAILKRKQWLQLIIIGLVGGSIPFLLFFKGLSLTSAAQGSFIHKTMFIYAAILAAIFLKEKISKEFLVGTLLLLVGCLFLLKTLPTSFGWGDLFVFLATILWAIENLISKYVLKELSPKIVAWGRMFFGSIFILIYLALTSQINLLSNLEWGQYSWTLITSILLFGYVLTWYSGLKYIPLSIATAILTLGSPITTLLSLISTHQINLKEIISLVLILSGIIFVIGTKYLWQEIKTIFRDQSLVLK